MSVLPASLGGPYATVIDAGAFRGDFARACLEQWPDTRVLSFEPLEPKPADTDTDRWTWFPTALGERDGRVTINRNEFVPSSSILPMAQLHQTAFPYTRDVTEAQIGIIPLDEFVELVDAPALLKIDVQGYELQVLKGAILVLARCQAVVLEVSWETLYHGAPTPTELAAMLQAAGFEHVARVDTLYHPKAPKLLLQSDELLGEASLRGRMSVHFFLTGGPLTRQYRRALLSAQVHDDEIVLWYTDDRPDAAGVTLRQALVPDWLEESHPQTKFNYLALATLYELGGMAFGLDSVSVAPAHDLLPDDKQLAVALGCPELGYVAANGHVYVDPFQTDYVARPGADAILPMLDDLEVRVRDRAHEALGVTEGGATGPLLLTRHVLDNPRTVAQVPFPALCGYEFSEAWRFYEGEPPGDGTRVIQLYASGYPLEYAALA